MLSAGRPFSWCLSSSAVLASPPPLVSCALPITARHISCLPSRSWLQDQIRSLITDLMLSTPLIVRAQLSEALSIISMHDFPNRWPDLLPRLVQKLQTGDPATINGVLHTLNSIYKRLRGQMMTDALSIELEVSQQVVKPLLHALEQLTQQVSMRRPGRLGCCAVQPCNSAS